MVCGTGMCLIVLDNFTLIDLRSVVFSQLAMEHPHILLLGNLIGAKIRRIQSADARSQMSQLTTWT